MKILYVINEDWFFVSHFLGLARAARAAGHEIAVATRVKDHGETIGAQGIAVLPVAYDRGKVGLLRAFATARDLHRLIRAEKPDLVHLITTQSIVLGGGAARLAGVRMIAFAPTGLGYLWAEKGVVPFIGRWVVRCAMRLARAMPNAIFFFENRDDPREFGLDPERDPRVTILGGAGVEPEDFPASPQPPAPPVRVAVVARMLRFKGIADAVEAVSILRARGRDIELELWGGVDPGSRRSVTGEELAAWNARPGVKWRGRSNNVAAVWRDSHIAMLLSHGGDGLPRSLVEAAASGRPIVTTDVAGCRAVVDDGVEGFLAPAKDPRAVADALDRLAADPALRERMGAAARRRFDAQFSAGRVTAAVLAAYARLQAALATVE